MTDLKRVSRRVFLGATGAAASTAALPRAARAIGGDRGESERRTDVVVVGGDLAGLTAAYRLAERGIDTVVLEAAEGTGSSSRSSAAGAHPSQEHLLALASDLRVGVETVRAGDHGVDAVCDHVAHRRAIAHAFRRLSVMATEVDASAPWTAVNAEPRDGLATGAWIEANVRDRDAGACLGRLVEAAWGVSPGEVSLLQLLAAVAASGGADESFAAFVAPTLRLTAGERALRDRLARASRHRSEILTPVPVRRVETEDTHVRAVADGIVVEARRAILAVSPAAATRVEFAPALPAARDTVHRRVAASGVFPPGVLSRVGSALREAVGPVHWAGVDTEPAWFGAPEGKVRAGERTASEVLAGLHTPLAGTGS